MYISIPAYSAALDVFWLDCHVFLKQSSQGDIILLFIFGVCCFSIINLMHMHMHILGETNALGSSESANPMDGDGSQRVFTLCYWVEYVPCFRTHALRMQYENSLRCSVFWLS